MMLQYILAWLEQWTVKALRTAAQAALAVIGTNAVGITDVDWVGVASASALAAIVCYLMGLTNLPEGD